MNQALQEVWVPSEYVAHSFWRSGVRRDKIQVIPNGVDCSRFSPAGAQYSLISSYSSFSRVILSSFAGLLADILNWINFYVLVTFFCLPALFILLFANKHFYMLSRKNKSF